MTQPSPRVFAIVTIAVFLICQFGFQTVGGSQNLLENFFRSYTWFWLPPLLTLLVLFRGRAFEVWGVTRAPLPMLALAFVISLPVLIGLFLTHASQAVSLEMVIATAVLPGLMEELLFRGFLFGLLYRYAGWNFWLAGTVAALVFGGVHLRQGHDLSSALGVFAITAFGGYWFGYLYVQWNSLWLPIGVHALLNLYAHIFPFGSNALGDTSSVILRALAVVFSIVLTRRLRKPDPVSSIDVIRTSSV
jgi:uncharacterized protein